MQMLCLTPFFFLLSLSLISQNCAETLPECTRNEWKITRKKEKKRMYYKIVDVLVLLPVSNSNFFFRKTSKILRI